MLTKLNEILKVLFGNRAIALFGLIIAILTLIVTIAPDEVRNILGLKKVQEYPEVTLEYIIRKAEKGDSYFQGILGSYYLRGFKVIKDCDNAVHWILKSKELNNPIGFYNLAYMYENGLCISKDMKYAEKYYHKALTAGLKELSEKGDLNALTYLGAIYRDGYVVKKDEVEALRLFQKAAQKGHYLAQFTVAWMYQHGKGVNKDEELAFKWYMKSAKQGYYLAEFNVGDMLFIGLGTKRNIEDSIRWLKRSALQNYDLAQFKLGEIYYKLQQYNEAINWLTNSAKQGNKISQARLGKIYYDKGDYEKSMKYYKMSANQDYTRAQVELGWVFQMLSSKTPDENKKYSYDKEAVKWYMIAAEKGNKEAMCNLGYMQETGRGGLEKNIDKAIYYYQMGAKFNSEKCIERLKGLAMK